MNWLGRVFLVAIALAVAIAAGAVALAFIALADPVFRNLAATTISAGFSAIFELLFHFDAPEEAAGILLGLWKVLVTLVALPPALTALVGEVARLRSYVWYGGASALVTAILPWLSRGGAGQATYAEMRITLGLFLTGAASGLVYWFLAGRSAGNGPAATPAAGSHGPTQSPDVPRLPGT